LFIVALLFDHSRRLFEAWMAQLTNYALITVLTVMLASLLLQIVDHYAAQTAALGSAIRTVDALDMLLVAVLVFLLMRQVMPIAAGLAGGATLHSMGMVSGALRGARRGLAGSAQPAAMIMERAVAAGQVAGVVTRRVADITGRVRQERRS
ncbi:MAG TPA: type IV secretion system protein, partial [Steroidobacteraceae bacterium]|nr:type IV secretion system protein [Steroidobacteraceae bacterium]